MAHIRQPLSSMTQLNVSTTQHRQEADQPVSNQQQQGIRQVRGSSARQRWQQPQPRRSERKPRLPDLRPRLLAARVSTKARHQQQRPPRSSNHLLIIVGLLHLLTVHFVLSIPDPPPLPQPYDVTTPKARA